MAASSGHAALRKVPSESVWQRTPARSRDHSFASGASAGFIARRNGVFARRLAMMAKTNCGPAK